MDTFYVNLWDDFFFGNGNSYAIKTHFTGREHGGSFTPADMVDFAIICWNLKRK